MAVWGNTLIVAALKAIKHIIQVAIERLKWKPPKANEKAEREAHYKPTGMRSPVNGKPYGIKIKPRSGKARKRG